MGGFFLYKWTVRRYTEYVNIWCGGKHMDAFFLSFQVVFPLLICMAVGFLVRRAGILGPATLKQLNNLVFRVFLPVMLFKNVYSTDLQTAFDGKLLLISIAFVFAIFFLLLFLVPHLEKDDRRRSVIMQGVFRSNYAIFGIPVVASLFGAEAVGTTSVAVAIIVPLFNALSVVVLESYQPSGAGVRKIVLGILKNPIIIGSAVGLLFLLVQVQLPSFLDKTVGDLASVTTPFALLVLGASFSFQSVKNCFWPLCLTVVGRLVLCPLLFLPIAVLLGLRGVSLASVACMIGAPTAVSTYTMAEQLGADGTLANAVVVFTSIFSILSMFLIVFILSSLGLF